MSTEPATMNWRDYVGRFSVEFEVANHEDVVQAKKGFLPPEQVRRSRISGVVDTGAARLVLPAAVVAALGLPEAGRVTVKFADGRREPKTVVGDVQVEIQGRSSVFTAVVEAGRADALIGAIVLEELDFVPDCTRQALLPRDPLGLIAEIDFGSGSMTATSSRGRHCGSRSCSLEAFSTTGSGSSTTRQASSSMHVSSKTTGRTGMIPHLRRSGRCSAGPCAG